MTTDLVTHLGEAVAAERRGEDGAARRVDAALETVKAALRTAHTRVEIIFGMSAAGLSTEQQAAVLRQLEKSNEGR